MRFGRVSAAKAHPADLALRYPNNMTNKILLTSLCACAALSILGSVVVAQGGSDRLRQELLAMLKIDQSERRACADGATAELVNCFDKLGKTIDKDNTRRNRRRFIGDRFAVRTVAFIKPGSGGQDVAI